MTNEEGNASLYFALSIKALQTYFEMEDSSLVGCTVEEINPEGFAQTVEIANIDYGEPGDTLHIYETHATHEF